MTWGDAANSGPNVQCDTQEWNVFPDVPLDIARLIFEKTMEDNPMPVHLALVSRQVQHWVEPLIYRNLTFHNPSCFYSFYRTFHNRCFSKTKTTAFLAKHAKSLHIYGHAAPEMEQLIALGRGLKGLKSVAAWYISHACYVVGFLAYDCTTFPTLRALDLNFSLGKLRVSREEWRDKQEKRRRSDSEANTPFRYTELEALGENPNIAESSTIIGQDSRDPFLFKDLRRFSTSVQALRELRLDFTHRIFRNPTHLNIYYCICNHSFAEMESCMGDTIQYCQNLYHLKVIILACVNWWTNDFDLLDDSYLSLNVSPDAWLQGGLLISTIAMNVLCIISREYLLGYTTLGWSLVSSATV